MLARQNFYMQEFYSEKNVKLTNDGYSALVWLRDNVERDSTVLCNVVTGGNIYIIGNCRGLMEGQMPFLNNSLLKWTLDAAYEARALYSGKGDMDIFEKYKIDYVILDQKGSLAGFNFVYPPKFTDLTECERLELAENFGYVKIFKVRE